jgi:hypothetical protein
MTDTAALSRQTLLRRETMVSAIVNAAISIGFFLLTFGWAPAPTRALAVDVLPQTFGITCLGGLVPSLMLLAKIRKGIVVPAGPAPTRAAQTLRVLGCAIVVTPIVGGSAALLMLAFAPATLTQGTALVVKALYGVCGRPERSKR